VLITSSTAAPNSTLQQRQRYSKQIYNVFASHPETEHVFQLDVPGQLLAGMVFTPWDKRSKTTNQLQPVVQQEVSKIAGVRAAVFQPPPLPGAFGLPVQFVLVTTDPYERLYTVSQAFLQEAQKSGMFIFLDSDLKFDNPQSDIIIDRDKTAQLGLKMSDVGSSLSAMLGGGYVNYFSMSGRSYKVIPQVQQRFRLNPQQLLDYYIKTADGSLVPLSTVAHVATKTVPEALNHFQQLNSATIQGVTMPGVAQGAALQYLQELAARSLPEGYSVDYAGLSRQYIQESGGFLVTISFAVIMIFLVLAALFESFRDPCIILVSVPMSIAGALIFVALGFGDMSLNIYTKVGLVTLIGLISKHGILIVQFANHLQEEQGLSKRAAIEAAAGIRLRPILMTTAAMVLGVVPLITATGAGAVSRFQMGVVIASGLSIGTLFTLFVVPAVYLLFAADHHRHGAVQTAESGEAITPATP
jgi:multidrug efflux pump